MRDEDKSTNTAIKDRIMLVDDEPDINAALSVVLKRGGYDVDTFESPLIALEKLKPRILWPDNVRCQDATNGWI